MNYKKIKFCRICNQNLKNKVLSFPATPPANEFVTSPVEQEKFPLDLMECGKCGHVQLSVAVNPDILFKNYVYVSGTSPSFVNHFKDYAKSIIDSFDLKQDKSIVLDIGSNDGTLLKAFKQYNLTVIGVDPAEKIAAQANKDGIYTINSFFNKDVVKKIKYKFGKIDVITANNVFAHTENLNEFVANVKKLLSKEGVFIFECSYLVDVINNMGWDTCYHEHISMHSLAPLITLFDSHKMKIFKVERVNTHGGSIRVFVSKQNSSHAEMPLDSLIKEENDLGLNISKKLIKKYNIIKNNKNIFAEYKTKIDNLGAKMLETLREIKSKNQNIVGFGAPAKFCTLSHTFGINKDLIDVVIDDSPLKQNLYTPGNHIKVVPSSYLKGNKVDYIVIFAWNFAENIIKNNSDYKGKWIIPIPEFKVI